MWLRQSEVKNRATWAFSVCKVKLQATCVAVVVKRPRSMGATGFDRVLQGVTGDSAPWRTLMLSCACTRTTPSSQQQ